MNPGEFKVLMDEFLNHEQEIMNLKAQDYTNDHDRLKNFRQIAQFEGRNMSQIAMSYLLKHVQSIALAVQAGDLGEDSWVWSTEDGYEGLKQRIADARNYLLLLAACLEVELHGSDKSSR